MVGLKDFCIFVPNLSTLKNYLIKMKKLILIAAAVVGMMTASAQQNVEVPSFWQNWQIGVDGGATTPLKGHSFFQNVRGVAGLHVQKMVTPTFGVGVEGLAFFNTSNTRTIYGAFAPVKSGTVVDNTYVGVYGVTNLMNLFGGYNGTKRAFEIEVAAGCGWLHTYWAGIQTLGHNDFATKAGLNLNYNVSDKVTLALKPSVIFNMTSNSAKSAVDYNHNRASLNVLASVSYNIGGNGFKLAAPCVDNSAELAALNGKVNDLRGALNNAETNLKNAKDQNAALAAELAAAKNVKPEVVKEVSNTLSSVRYVFYKIGSSVITADQQPNVEMVAQYLKNHKGSKVVVKGYASQDGNQELNIKLAQARAESVKKMLVNRYKIDASRIQAEGEGIGHMFSEESWNRVSICTIED